jgi:putative toxin-antitoxin system antitoxin component (TIGR02293 family)
MGDSMQTELHGSSLGWRAVVKKVVQGRQPGRYAALRDVAVMERINMIRAGMPASAITRLADDMAVSRDRIYDWVRISRATGNRKISANVDLNQDETERMIGIMDLVGQVEKMVTESGDEEAFDAAQWTAQWLDESNSALGGQTPGALLDSAEGRTIVSRLVAQMQSGAYA